MCHIRFLFAPPVVTTSLFKSLRLISSLQPVELKPPAGGRVCLSEPLVMEAFDLVCIARTMLARVSFPLSDGSPLRLRCASACSGTECCSAVWAALRAATQSSLSLEPVFACENDQRKQKWIRQNFPALQILYENIEELGNSCAKDICSGSGDLSENLGNIPQRLCATLIIDLPCVWHCFCVCVLLCLLSQHH